MMARGMEGLRDAARLSASKAKYGGRHGKAKAQHAKGKGGDGRRCARCGAKPGMCDHDD